MYDYYDEPPYYEQSLADEILMEYQQKMKDALLESVKNQIEQIKTENESLKQQNEELRNKSYEVNRKERELQEKEKSLEIDFFRKKFSELLKPFEEKYSGYYAEYTYRNRRKCKQCDEERKITFIASNGKTIKQNCECSNSYSIYVPKHTTIEILSLHKSNEYYKKEFGIKPQYEDDNDDYRWCKLNFTKFIDVFDESIANDLGRRDTLFVTKEECKKYCDWLNKNKDADEVEEDCEE